MIIKDVALQLTSKGISIITTNRDKLPTIKWGEFQNRIATEGELQAMFSKPKVQGIATIGGAVSGGLEILDFDNHKNAGIEGRIIRNIYPTWAELVKLQRPKLFDKLVINRTPSGGYHIRYRYKADDYAGNAKLAEAWELDQNGEVILDEHNRPKKVAIIETRGEGGYALCPPSPNYEMIQGDILAIPTISKEERDFLIGTAKSLHVIQNDIGEPSQIQPTDELRPGDDYNQRGDHRALLEKHGWVFALERNDIEYWRRPGKEGNSWSATWNGVPERFYVFSTNASPLEDGRTYDRFALYTLLEHDGDFNVAARALAAEGYGSQKQSAKDTQKSSDKKNKGITDENRAKHLTMMAKRWKKQGLRRKEIIPLIKDENESKCEPSLSEDEFMVIVDRVAPKLETITADELLAMELPEPKWAIPNFIPEGLTILAGRPKIGKSWMGLGFAVATAQGGYAFGKVQVEQGEALFIGLEDNWRRLQDRLAQMLENEAHPPKLHLLTELPRLDQGGLEMLADWLDEHPDTRLVVIDTLQKVRPLQRKGSDAYSEDYGALGMLQRFAMNRGVAVLVVHHTRKAEADYVLDEISGTTGISAAADSIMILKNSLNGTILHTTGRDIDTQELAIRFDKMTGIWELLGDAREYAISEQRRAIVEVLRESDEPLAPKEIAEALQKNRTTVRRLLQEMIKAGEIEKDGSKYVCTMNSMNDMNSMNTMNSMNSVHVFTGMNSSMNSNETSQGEVSSDSVHGVHAVHGDDTEQEEDNSSTKSGSDKLTNQLEEYLSVCPHSWVRMIKDGIKQNKFPLSRAVEASRRMSNGDSQGAWRLIRQDGGRKNDKRHSGRRR